MNIHSIPKVITIAGHDPCAGAGITADIKAFEQHEVYGLSVISAITVQNDSEFNKVYPIDTTLMIEQIDILLKRYDIEVVKIGLINDFEVLKRIVSHLKECLPKIKIIWDPILKSSSGFNIHNNMNIDTDVLSKLFLITPNFKEYKFFERNNINLLKYPCLLKGGHNDQKPGTDILVIDDKYFEIEGTPFDGKTKHGTGCILSASIAANLAKGLNIYQSCEKAKRYVEQFILSSDSNLGLHQKILSKT